MNDEQDATVETATAPPLVSIEYRERGIPMRLIGPSLILLACLAITAHRRLAPVVPPPHEPAKAGVEPVAIAPAAPLEVRIVTMAPPPPPPQPDPPPDDTPPPPPAPPEPRPRVGFVPPSENADVTPVAPPAVAPRERDPLPSKEQVWEEIQREAARKRAESDQFEAQKPRLVAWELAEARRQARENRAPFQKELRQVLKAQGNRAGPAINRLCDQYGRVTRGEIQYAVSHALTTTYARVGRPSKVAAMRALGLPEPLILDFLARDLDVMINTRGGPRDPHEVRVRAARLLLTMPVGK